MGRLWRTMKLEWAHPKAHSNGGEAQAGLKLYFHFYDTQPPHQALDFRPQPKTTRKNNGILHRRDWILALFSSDPVQLMGPI